MQQKFQIAVFAAFNAWVIWLVHPMVFRIGVSCVGLLAFVFIQAQRPTEYRWSSISLYKSLGFSALSMSFTTFVFLMITGAIRHSQGFE